MVTEVDCDGYLRRLIPARWLIRLDDGQTWGWRPGPLESYQRTRCYYRLTFTTREGMNSDEELFPKQFYHGVVESIICALDCLLLVRCFHS